MAGENSSGRFVLSLQRSKRVRKSHIEDPALKLPIFDLHEFLSRGMGFKAKTAAYILP